MKMFYSPNTKYYKYTDIPFVQPVLHANGTVGGDTFAVYYSSSLTPSGSNHDGYHAFDNNSSTYWRSSGDMPQWIGFYNPQPLNVTKLTITNDGTEANVQITAGKVQASNDNLNWTDLTSWTNSVSEAGASWDIPLSSNTEPYKYYKVYITSCNYQQSGTYYAVIAEIGITATQTILVESTSSDYDIIIEGNTYQALGGKAYLY